MINLDNPIVKKCLWLCFTHAFHTDLDSIANHRNSHKIQPQRGYAELPSAKPDVLYFVPELTDGQTPLTPVNAENVNVSVCITCTCNLYGKKKETCNEEFKERVNINKTRCSNPSSSLWIFGIMHWIERRSQRLRINKSQKISTNIWFVCIKPYQWHCF